MGDMYARTTSFWPRVSARFLVSVNYRQVTVSQYGLLPLVRYEYLSYSLTWKMESALPGCGVEREYSPRQSASRLFHPFRHRFGVRSRRLNSDRKPVLELARSKELTPQKLTFRFPTTSDIVDLEGLRQLVVQVSPSTRTSPITTVSCLRPPPCL